MYNSLLEWSSDKLNITDVLDLTRKKIESINPVDDRFLRSRGNDNGFEKLFPKILGEIANELAPQNELSFKVHTGHHFPDVDLIFNGIKYGVELKSRNNGSWTTNGNSVLESITGEGYNEIYLVFASKVPREKRLLVKFAPYWSAASNIKVTHSPRFTIDMNTSNSVFESKAEYETLRSKSEEEKVMFLQNYLREKSIGSGAKWYVAPNESVSPTNFSDLSLKKRAQLRIEILILFLDDLLLEQDRVKYTRSAEYLLETYLVYNKNIRDLFSAGGVYNYHGVSFPNIIGRLVSNKELLAETLNSASSDFFELAKASWAKNLPTSLVTDNLYDSYRNILDYIGFDESYNIFLKQANVARLSDIVL